MKEIKNALTKKQSCVLLIIPRSIFHVYKSWWHFRLTSTKIMNATDAFLQLAIEKAVLSMLYIFVLFCLFLLKIVPRWLYYCTQLIQTFFCGRDVDFCASQWKAQAMAQRKTITNSKRAEQSNVNLKRKCKLSRAMTKSSRQPDVGAKMTACLMMKIICNGRGSSHCTGPASRERWGASSSWACGDGGAHSFPSYFHFWISLNAIFILVLIESYSRTLHSKLQSDMSNGWNSVALTKSSGQRDIFQLGRRILSP